MARFTDDQGFDLVSWDAATGRSVWAKEEAEGTTYRTDYPVDSILKLNGEQRAIADKAWKGDYHQVASIPLNMFYDSGLAQASSEGDDKFVSRWLNDGDNAAFRTKEGTV